MTREEFKYIVHLVVGHLPDGNKVPMDAVTNPVLCFQYSRVLPVQVVFFWRNTADSNSVDSTATELIL